MGILRSESKDLPTATEHATVTRLQDSWLPFLGCLPHQLGTLGKKKRSEGLEWRFPTSEEEIHPHPPWSKEEHELWSQTDCTEILGPLLISRIASHKIQITVITLILP